MNEELEIFQALHKSNPEANDYFNEQIQNIEYGEHLIDLLEQNFNSAIFDTIAMVFKYYAKIHSKTNEGREILNTFNPKIVELLFNSTPEKRTQLIDSLEVQCRNQNTGPIFELLHPYINPETSIQNICTCIPLISLYLLTNANNEEFNEHFVNYFAFVTDIIINQQSSLTSKQMLVFVQFLNDIINCLKEMPEINSLQAITDVFFARLDSEDATNEGYQMKSSIIQIFTLWVAKYFMKNQEFNDVLIEPIEEKVIGLISALIPQRNDNVDNLLSYLLMHAYAFIKKLERDSESGLKERFYLNQEFVEQILIPASILSSSQIYEFFANPSQYVAFIIGESFQTNEPYLRCHTCSIIRQFKGNEMSELLLDGRAEDPYELEARIFLLLSYYRTERTIKRSMPAAASDAVVGLLGQLDTETIAGIDPEDILPQIEGKINEYREEISQLILAPTLMMAAVRARRGFADLRDFGMTLFMGVNENSSVVRTAALALFYSGLSSTNELNCENIDELIATLVTFDRCASDSTLKAEALSYMMDCSPEVVAHGVQLYPEIMEAWVQKIDEISSMDEQDDVDESLITEAGNYLMNMCSIINALPPAEVAAKIDETLGMLDSMVENQRYQGLDIFEVLIEIFVRVDSIPESALSVLPLLHTIVQGHLAYELDGHIGNLATILILLIQKGGLAKNEEARAEALALLGDLVSNFEIMPEDVKDSFIALSSLLSAAPDTAGDILGLAVARLESDQELPVGPVYILSAALKAGVGPGDVPEQLIQAILEGSSEPDNFNMMGLREIRAWLWALFVLAQNGIEGALDMALSALMRLARLSKREYVDQKLDAMMKEVKGETAAEEEEEAPMEEEEDEDDMLDDDPDGGAEYIIDPRVIVPVEDKGILRALVNAAGEAGAELDPKIIAIATQIGQ